MKKTFSALATAILYGGYAAFCIALGLFIIFTVLGKFFSVFQSVPFYIWTLATISVACAIRIFYVQLKNPS